MKVPNFPLIYYSLGHLANPNPAVSCEELSSKDAVFGELLENFHNEMSTWHPWLNTMYP